MTAATVDVNTSPDGTLILQPRGVLAAEDAIWLRRTLVRAIRHTRPLRLTLELSCVQGLDPVNLGTLAAAYAIGDDHQVAVFFDHPSAYVAELLTSAGVPRHRLRYIAQRFPVGLARGDTTRLTAE
ncbi:STAS domain-containing protein [Actinoplanes sp. NPDC049681]|uniref:STAS domain-containing protein n=1 Tax=Actinoplanes sp. NPDC049681 TaxID=3363905 RepID=UPI00378FDF8E